MLAFKSTKLLFSNPLFQCCDLCWYLSLNAELKAPVSRTLPNSTNHTVNRSRIRYQFLFFFSMVLIIVMTRVQTSGNDSKCQSQSPRLQASNQRRSFEGARIKGPDVPWCSHYSVRWKMADSKYHWPVWIDFLSALVPVSYLKWPHKLSSSFTVQSSQLTVKRGRERTKIRKQERHAAKSLMWRKRIDILN